MKKFRLLFCIGWHFLAVWSFGSDSNIALTRPVTASGAVSGPASNVTDGDASTSTAPATAGVVGFYYQIDLGKEYPLQAIYLASKVNDGTNKLSRVRMAVYSDNGGVAGVENWGYEIRADGSNNPQGSVDLITGNLHPAGNFRGRFVRLTNVANTLTAPQIAEISVYEAPLPTVKFFGPDAGNITKMNAPGKPTQAVLAWNVAGYTSLSIDQGIGAVTGPTGSIVVSPNTTTTYTLRANNGAGEVTVPVTIGVDQPELPPFLSEVLASNVGGIKDPHGKRSDWIEIGNPNAFAINVKNYYLTDNALVKTKWRFPDFIVPGNGYAIVWATGTALPVGPLEVPETNFSLASEGEYVGLIGTDGVTVVSQFPLDYPVHLTCPQQRQDRSYGVTGGQEGYFQTPTPNAANGPRFDGIVLDTVFNVKRGFYSTPQTVTITSLTLDAQIRYTFDGSSPTATTGTVYTTGIPVSATTVLKVAAFKAGWVPTNVDVQTYVFPADVKATAPSKGWAAVGVINAMSDAQVDAALKEIPSLSMSFPPGVVVDGGTDKLGTLEWLDGAGGATFQIPCGVQLFGGAFTNFAKKSYRISFKGEYGASKLRFPLFTGHERSWAPVEEFDQLEVRNGSHDMAARGFYMSNAFTDATMLDMGSFAPHGRFVHLYMNGNYWGVHHLRERWSADMMSSYYGGDATAYESVNGNLNVGGWADPGVPYDGTGAQWTSVKALARSGGDTFTKLKPYLDIPQYVDYMTMFMFGKSEDEYRVTGPVGLGHGMKFVLNDADGYLFYQPYGGPAINRTTMAMPGKSAGDGPGSLFSMLWRDGGKDYRTLLADRIHRAYVMPGGALTPEANVARLNQLCGSIALSMPLECARWNYTTPSGWLASRDACLTWFGTRTTDILNIYRTAGFYPSTVAPVFDLPPGIVTSGAALGMTTTTAGGTIYYTMDGSDPRLAGAVGLNTPLLSTSTGYKYRVPTSANDGVTPSDIPNLVAYYGLNTSAVETMNGLNGVLTNGTSFVTPGKQGGGAALLDGANDNIQLGNPDALKITGQITLSAWVRATSIVGVRDVISKGTDTAVAPNGETFLRINNGAWEGGILVGTTLTSVAGPATGTNSALSDVSRYAHIAIVYDGTTWRLYRNGVQIASLASGTGAVAATTGWALGARGPGDLRFFSGQIDEVRIYDRGLTAAEVGTLAATTAAIPGVQWTQPSYVDAAWLDGAGALGFAPVGDLLASGVTQDIGGVMSGVNASLYQRHHFEITAQMKLDMTALELRMKSDDGYAVYLNGNRVAGRNAAAFLSGTATATAETPDATALETEKTDLSASIPALLVGTNVLAVQGLNLTAGDDDFLLDTQLQAQRGPVGLASGAIPFTGVVPLTKSAVVKARTYLPLTQQWSALQETFYQVGSDACPVGALAVSELHYNPTNDDDGEFIELMNVSSGAINLRGLKFTDGVVFQFPTNRDTSLAPGAKLVLVDSELTFQRIHGWASALGGIYSSTFDNGGERVRIVAADGITTLVDFTYDGKAPWPDAADGGGRSLVLIRPRVGIDHNDPANWRVSLQNDGNPNALDGLTFSGNPTADADGDGLTAVMEFALGTSDAVRNGLPMTASADAIHGLRVTLDHANGADAANLMAEVSEDLITWTTPVQLTERQLLPNGQLRSTWQSAPTQPMPEMLYLRFRTLWP